MTGSTARDDTTAGAADPTEVSVVIPADPNRLAIPRSIAATLAAALDFDIDAVADLRIAVDEMVSTVLVRARPGSQVTTVFRAQPGSIWVECSVASDDRGDFDEGSFGWMVLSTLGEDLRARVDGVADDGPQLKLSMTMRIPRGVR